MKNSLFILNWIGHSERLVLLNWMKGVVDRVVHVFLYAILTSMSFSYLVWASLSVSCVLGIVIGYFYTSIEKPLKMRCCRSYLFIKLMLFLWFSPNPHHIGMVKISKCCLFVVEPEIPLSPLCFKRGNRSRMLLLT